LVSSFETSSSRLPTSMRSFLTDEGLADLAGAGAAAGFAFGAGRGVLQGDAVDEARRQRGARVRGLRLLQVVVVVAGVGRQPARVHVQDVLRQGADEVHVVADEDERPVVRLERAHEGVDRGDVEVRRRLVHQEEVRRLDEEAREREARLLAAGEDGHLLVDVVLAEEEGAEDRAALLLGELVLVRPQLHHVLEDRRAGGEVIEAVLGEVAGDDVAAELARPALDRDDAGQDLEERRLARAVRPDEHDPLAALRHEVEVPVDDLIAVGLVDVLQLDHLEPERGGLGNLKWMRFRSSWGSSTATASRRSICFSLDLAREAMEALAPKRSTNFWRWAISRCWFLKAAACCSLRASFSSM
jgi:hypothetical protein